MSRLTTRSSPPGTGTLVFPSASSRAIYSDTGHLFEEYVSGSAPPSRFSVEYIFATFVSSISYVLSLSHTCDPARRCVNAENNAVNSENPGATLAFFDAEYTFSRNGIAHDRVQVTYYEAGHMMYTHEPDFVKLSEDIRAFLSN